MRAASSACSSDGAAVSTPHPTDITLHTESRCLEVGFDDGSRFRIPYELMRIYSPSAEVQGHGPGQEVLQSGKREVQVLDVASVGNYAIRPSFSDGHDSGIFSWTYLHFLGSQGDALWAQYAQRLQAAGRDRDDPMPVAGRGGACAA